MKNVLIITYYFPPMGGSGVQRTLKFVKYLRQFGWEPIILTLKEFRSGYFAYDSKLSNELPKDIKIFRVYPSLGILIYFFFGEMFSFIGLKKLGEKLLSAITIPDMEIFWIPLLLLKVRKLLKQKKIDLIYTSAPPQSLNVLGILLKKLYKVKWVADYRDPWTHNAFYNDKPDYKDKLNRYLELKAHNKADLIIANTGGNRRKIINEFGVSPQTIHVLTNGYDEKDFEHIGKNSFDNDKFNIVYTGAFYHGYTPDAFLVALSLLFSQKEYLKKEFNFHLAGILEKKTEVDILSKIGQMKLDHITIFYGNLPHSESVSLLTKADLLLLILWSGKGSDSCIPAKIFEYLRSGKPILAIVPEKGECAELIIRLKAGIVVEPDDVKGIQDAIYDCYELWKEHKLGIKMDWQEISNYERQHLTKKLAKLFESIS
ncbi:MAG: glycosyltransferase [Thermodesulfobacteriota bacterium]|nr:glycosyltransferase [Thermodesulfobacteriota bacterium]